MIPLLPEVKLHSYHTTIIHGKTYLITLLWFSVKRLDRIITLTRCPSNDILSLIILTWCLLNENLKSCLWLIIDRIYYVSLYFHIYICVCYVSLCLFMLKVDRLTVWSRVQVLLNWYFSNTITDERIFRIFYTWCGWGDFLCHFWWLGFQNSIGSKENFSTNVDVSLRLTYMSLSQRY